MVRISEFNLGVAVMSTLKIILICVGLFLLGAVAVQLLFFGGFYFLMNGNKYEVKDGKVFYYTTGIGSSEVVGADAATFKKISGGDNSYGSDQNNIYFKGTRLPNADLSTFAPLKQKYWSKDKNQVYYGAELVNGLDVAGLRFLSDNYATDGKAIYCSGKQLVGADVATFQIESDGGAIAKDKNHYYHFEERGTMVNGDFKSDQEATSER